MNSANSDDEGLELELAQRCHAGDRGARDELLHRYFSVLRRFFGTRVSDPDACDDLIQDTMHGLLEALPRFEGRSSLRSYVFRIAHNQLNLYLRARYRDAAKFDPAITTAEDVFGRSLSSLVEVRDRSKQMLRIMTQELSIDEQSLLQLWCWDGLSGRELSEVFGVSANATRARLHRAREQLRRKIVAEDDAALDKQLRQLGDDITI